MSKNIRGLIGDCVNPNGQTKESKEKQQLKSLKSE